jgi:uncharacterized membrane protein
MMFVSRVTFVVKAPWRRLLTWIFEDKLHPAIDADRAAMRSLSNVWTNSAGATVCVRSREISASKTHRSPFVVSPAIRSSRATVSQ